MHRRRFVLFLVLAVVAAALLLPAVAPAMTYDQAVDQLYAKGYPQNVETYLNSLGSSPLGFRLGGTVADDTAARYLERKLRAAGYDNVKLEAVPVDEWAVRGASVTVDGHTFVCSQFAGVPGTGEDGITAEVVYVGNGLAADYEGVDVRRQDRRRRQLHGQLLVQLPGRRGHQARRPRRHPDEQLLGRHRHGLPVRSLVRRPAGRPGRQRRRVRHELRPAHLHEPAGRRLAQGRDRGRLHRGHVRQRGRHHAGRGRRRRATTSSPRCPASRRTARWSSGTPTTTRTSAPASTTPAPSSPTLAAAKAMKMSGYAPNRTVKFVFDTAEEFGYTDCWYDWSIGAWHFITQRHPDWVGKIAAMYSIELMAAEGATVDINTSPELVPWLDEVCADNGAADAERLRDRDAAEHVAERLELHGQRRPQLRDLGRRPRLRPPVPQHLREPGHGRLGHDGQHDQAVHPASTSSATAAQLPYDFVGRAADLREHFDPDELAAAGLVGGRVNTLDAAITRFSKVSKKFGASAAAITGDDRGPASRNDDHAQGRQEGREGHDGPRRLGLHRLPARADDVGQRVHDRGRGTRSRPTR